MLGPKIVYVGHHGIVKFLDYLSLLVEVARNILKQGEILIETGL